MFYRGEGLPNSPFNAGLAEYVSCELSSVIGYQPLRCSKSAYYLLPYDVLYTNSYYGRDGFNFYPFSEVFDGHYQEFHLSSCKGKRPNMSISKYEKAMGNLLNIAPRGGSVPVRVFLTLGALAGEVLTVLS